MRNPPTAESGASPNPTFPMRWLAAKGPGVAQESPAPAEKGGAEEEAHCQEEDPYGLPGHVHPRRSRVREARVPGALALRVAPAGRPLPVPFLRGLLGARLLVATR